MYELSQMIRMRHDPVKKGTVIFSVLLLCFLLMSCVTAGGESPHSQIPILAEIPILKKLLKKEEILNCLVKGGSAHFPEGWYDFEIVRFDLVRGEERNVSLYRKKKLSQSSFYARFEKNGQHLVFCPIKDELEQDEKVSCLSLYALEEDFQTGIKRTFDVPNIVRGGVVECKRKEIP